MRRPRRSLLLAVALVGLGLGLQAPARAEVTLLNVSYDPTRELYRIQRGRSPEHWKAEDRRGRHDPDVARRLGQAGARGHRRPRRRRRDAGARLRHRRDRRAEPAGCRRTGRRGCRTTARPTPRPSCSWCARATPRASRTGATWSSATSRSSRRTRRPRAARAGTTWPPGATRCAPAGRRRGQGEGRSSPTLFQHVPVLDTGARGSTHLRPARHRRRAAGLGERGLSGCSTNSAPSKFEIVVPSVSILAEPPVARGRQGGRRGRHAQGRRGLSRSTSTRPRARSSRPSTTTGRPPEQRRPRI